MKDKQIILVTGASDGIGKEIARQLLAQHHHVILGVRDMKKGHLVAKELRAVSDEVSVFRLDVTIPMTVKVTAQQVKDKFGYIDALVNNAGVALDRGPVSNMLMSDVKMTFATNIIGTIDVTQQFIPLLKKSPHGHGRIVNVSSGLASLTNMTDEESQFYDIALPVYAASKAALNVFTIHLSRELKSSGISVNAVDPSLTATRYVQHPDAQPVSLGAEAAVKYALMGEDCPTEGFYSRKGVVPW
ncbi:SDR family NAD(P)-dependent oxidoreductase [Scandinavium sp.]|uniref:SDR family NAD(P)-dependent oxidoreductase n=1 Tax=Scandinavium sp. TaxID=2830653 RepID=UPI00289EF64B|nr:SDR family NAD(P)-dependent oxidoreductase [Scandinavium sp.]